MKRRRIVRERLTEPRKRKRERLAGEFTTADFEQALKRIEERRRAKEVLRETRRRDRLLQPADARFIEIMQGLASSSQTRRHRSAIKLARHCVMGLGDYK